MKKIISILLCFIILFSGVSVYAENDEMSSENIRLILAELGIMNGYPDGTFRPENNVTRAEFARIAISASAYRDYVASGMNTSPFADVPYTHWAAPYIKLASVNKIIFGYPDSTFKPENNVLLEEAVSIVVKLLGYNDDDYSASWPYGQLAIAKSTGLLDNISATQGSYLTRGEVAQLIYNLLRTKPKNATSSEVEYISTIGFSLKEDVTILATAKEDSSLGFGKVATSIGSYKIDENFDSSIVGKQGYVLHSDSNEFLLFIGDDYTTVNYNVYSVLENEIVAYKDGALVSLKLSDNLTVYYKLQTYTMGTIKKSLNTGYLLSVSYDKNGNAKYVTVNDNALEGPVIIYSDTFQNNFGLSSNPTIIRNGNKSDITNITKHDVIYYSKSIDMLWAYSKKITGIYEEAYPNRDAVSSIKLSGTTYTIESAQAAAALSSSGEFSLGNTITVLFGKDNGIAGVISPENVSSNIYGYVTAAGTSEFADSDGNITSSRYVQIVQTDGSVIKYKTNNNYSSFLNKVVKITLSEGVAKLSSENVDKYIGGIFDFEKHKFGDYTISDNIKILEVTSNNSNEPANYTTLFAKRLDGLNINNSKVLHCATDSKGQITDLIFLNVTGDAYEYGIITKTTIVGNGGTYTGFMGTTPVTASSQSKKYSVSEGQPVQFVLNGNSIVSIIGLTQVTGTIESISYAYVETASSTYKISDDCVVYNSQNNVITLNDAINSSNYKYMAYVDKYSRTVRVIKALDK